MGAFNSTKASAMTDFRQLPVVNGTTAFSKKTQHGLNIQGLGTRTTKATAAKWSLTNRHLPYSVSFNLRFNS